MHQLPVKKKYVNHTPTIERELRKWFRSWLAKTKLKDDDRLVLHVKRWVLFLDDKRHALPWSVRQLEQSIQQTKNSVLRDDLETIYHAALAEIAN